MNLMKILLTITILCISITSCKDFQSNDLAFDQSEWKKADTRLRGRMSRSLITQKILLEKTRDEVIKILGEADVNDLTFVKYDINLGAIHERWIQKYFLVVMFDGQTQKVKTAGIID